MTDPEVLSVREAADIMGVSMQRVRQMISNGQIAARRSSAGWLIPAGAITDRPGSLHQGRPPAAQTVWSAVALLAAASDLAAGGASDEAVSAAQVVSDRKVRHRVLRLLAGMPDPAIDDTPWRRFLSSRGEVRRLWAHPGVLERLAADPKVSAGGTDAALAGHDGLTSDARQLELYVRDTDVDEVVQRYRMREDRSGPVNLVIVPSSVPAGLAPRGGRPVPAPAAAADLLEEEDPRARRAAVTQLQASMHALQAAGWLDRTAARLAAGSQ